MKPTHKIICVLIIPFTLLAVGCGKKGEDAMTSKRLGETTSGALVDFAAGMGVGIDKKMEVKPVIAEPIFQSFDITISKVGGMGINTLAIYSICKKPFEGRLVAKAFDEKDREIGRSFSEVKMKIDDASYIVFHFHEQMDTQLVKRYSVDLAEPKAVETGTAQK